MLKLSPNIHGEWTSGCPHRTAKLAVGPSTERPAEIVRDGLTKVIAVIQNRAADRYSSRVYGLHLRSLVLSAVEEFRLVGEFLFELTLKSGNIFWSRLLQCQIVS